MRRLDDRAAATPGAPGQRDETLEPLEHLLLNLEIGSERPVGLERRAKRRDGLCVCGGGGAIPVGRQVSIRAFAPLPERFSQPNSPMRVSMCLTSVIRHLRERQGSGPACRREYLRMEINRNPCHGRCTA